MWCVFSSSSSFFSFATQLQLRSRSELSYRLCARVQGESSFNQLKHNAMESRVNRRIDTLLEVIFPRHVAAYQRSHALRVNERVPSAKLREELVKRQAAGKQLVQAKLVREIAHDHTTKSATALVASTSHRDSCDFSGRTLRSRFPFADAVSLASFSPLSTASSSSSFSSSSSSSASRAFSTSIKNRFLSLSATHLPFPEPDLPFSKISRRARISRYFYRFLLALFNVEAAFSTPHGQLGLYAFYPMSTFESAMFFSLHWIAIFSFLKFSYFSLSAQLPVPVAVSSHRANCTARRSRTATSTRATTTRWSRSPPHFDLPLAPELESIFSELDKTSSRRKKEDLLCDECALHSSAPMKARSDAVTSSSSSTMPNHFQSDEARRRLCLTFCHRRQPRAHVLA